MASSSESGECPPANTPVVNPQIDPRPSGHSGHSDTPDAVEPYTLIPKNLSKDPKNWTRADLQKFLFHNKTKYDLDDSDIKVFLDRKVPGSVFLRLTRERLCEKPYNLEDGAADVIEGLINELKESQELIECTCTFIYGRETKSKKLLSVRGRFSGEYFRTQALELFHFPEGTETSDLTLEVQVEDDKKRKQHFLLDEASFQDAAASGSTTFVISTNQRPFSSWTFQEFKTQFNLRAESYEELPKFKLGGAEFGNGIEGLIDDAFKEVEKAILICPTASSGNESTRSLVVYEILKQVTCHFGGKFSLYVEKQVSGKLGRGPLDYVIEYGGLLIVIVEAKRRDLDQGVAQCAIQLDSARHINIGKRKRPDEDDQYKPDHIFGIVTTGDCWVFLQISKEHGALVHDEAPLYLTGLKKAYRGQLKDQIRSLFKYTLAIYQDVMSNTPMMKRQKE